MKRNNEVIARHTRHQKTFYNTHTTSYLAHASDAAYAVRMVKRMLSSLSKKRRSVLEVGAGQGRFSLELSRHVGSLTAIDLSSYEIEELKRQVKNEGVTNIHASVHDVLTIRKTLNHGAFDQVVGFFVLHHLHNEAVPEIVPQFVSFLKKGGRVSFIEPNKYCPSIFIEVLFLKDMNWQLERMIYSDYLDRFQKMCVDAGLKLTYKKVFGFFPPFMINAFPWLGIVESYIEKLPVLSGVLCPFILLTFEKNT